MEDLIGVIAPAIIGVAFVALGVPLMRRRVPRDGWYGFRIGATLRDDEIWYAVNERGGRHLVILGGTLIAVALIGLWFTGDVEAQRDLLILDLAVIGGGLAYSGWVCVVNWRAIWRYFWGAKWRESRRPSPSFGQWRSRGNRGCCRRLSARRWPFTSQKGNSGE